MSSVRSFVTFVLFVLALCSGALGCEESGGGSFAGARPTAINLTPPGLSLAAGTAADLRAIVIFDNQATRDVSSYAAWSSSDNTIARVSGGHVVGVKAGTVTITASGEGQTRSTQVVVTSALLVSLALTPSAPSVAKGLKTQLVATGTFSDRTTQDLSTQVTWLSSAPATATVDAKGLVSALAAGPATITAGMGTVSGNTAFTVTDAKLATIELTPSAPTVPKGLIKQMTATGVFTDGTKQNLTTQVSWASTSPEIASIDATTGLAATHLAGTTSISASVMGITGTTPLTVSNAGLVSIEVTPATPTKAKGLTEQLTATGTFTDATKQDLTTQVAWTSNAAAVEVSNVWGSNGLAFTPSVGTATVTATLSAISGSATFTVTPAELLFIEVTPSSASKAKGLTQQFTATGNYTDKSTQNLTTTATWRSNDESRVIVSNADGSRGLASTVGAGAVTITATAPGGAVSGSTPFTVTAAALISIRLEPGPFPALSLGRQLKFEAWGLFTDGERKVTEEATWSTGSAGIATISNAAGSRGLVSTKSEGTVSITAMFDGASGSINLAVTPAVLTSITVTPGAASIAVGAKLQYTAIGHYSNGDFDITNLATWSSADETVASFPNPGGEVLGKIVGATVVQASRDGVFSNIASLSVR
jgi:hypothetical protein